MPKQLAMYVDGWNFYWSLVGAGLKPYGWCNFPLLAKQQAFSPDAEVAVKYFTSADRPNEEKIADRQRPKWWQALRFIGCGIVEGEFRSTREEVEEQNRIGGKIWREKQTDVALASHMVADCSRITPDPEQDGSFRWSPGYDEAIILTGDTDFIPAVRIVSTEPFNRRVRVLLPPAESGAQENAGRLWTERARGRNVIIKQLQLDDLGKALLPLVVTSPSGQSVTCHRSWMWREKHEETVARRPKPVYAPGGSSSTPRKRQ